MGEVCPREGRTPGTKRWCTPLLPGTGAMGDPCPVELRSHSAASLVQSALFCMTLSMTVTFCHYGKYWDGQLVKRKGLF